MVTAKPFCKIWYDSLWVLLSLNLTYVPHMLNFAKTLEGETERQAEIPDSIEH